MKKTKLLFSAILIGLLLIVASCGNDDSSNSKGNNLDTTTGEPQEGGTLRMAFGSEDFKDTLIPGLATDAFNQNIVRMLFDGLAHQTGDLELEPRIAESWEISEDKMSLNVILNEDAKWSDGEPITSEDILFSFNTFASQELIALGGDGGSELSTIKGYSDIQEGKEESFEDTDGFEIISDYEFNIHFNELDAKGISNILIVRPIPKHKLDDEPIKDWKNHPYVQEPDVTSGPYHVKEVQKPTTSILGANEDYYLSKPNISEIVVQGVNVDVAPGLFANGELDYMMKGINVSDIEDLESIDNIQVVAKPGDIFEYVGLKHTKPQFQDVNVRQALMYAIPRELIIDSIYKGNAEILNSPITEIINSHATEDDGMNPYEFDIDKANELLDEAGWELDEDENRIDPNTGEPANFNLMYTQDNKKEQDLATTLQKYIEDIGITITLQPEEGTTKSDKIQDDDDEVDMWIGAWGAIGDDPKGLWYTGMPWNWPRWSDEKNDELIKATYATEDAFDEDKRTEALIDWQLYVNEQVPLLFLWTYYDVVLMSDQLSIPEEEMIDLGSTYNPQNWWLNQ
ncbi:MAG TPA: ABC transporter substrate-binding protein [Pseudogracilibacillus sp.]|nr:ABC transporter substrate-binding protein [Pseudogracilibacillus sp.]